MAWRSLKIYFLFYFISFVHSDQDDLMTPDENFLKPISFVFWPKGIIPFYINNEHFDYEQSLVIMTSLSLVAFRSCLKFTPVMVRPAENEHVLTFENPTGVRKCDLLGDGHSPNGPHTVNLGYDCLLPPWMDRVVLRALGLPFEHNRGIRDSYIDVQYENIEQSAIPLYTKEFKLPAAFRALPYDVDSALHFGDRDFSKNGHRTIIFKDRDTKQKRDGMSDLDIRKLELIYGPECRERGRQEKIALCHHYPSVPLARYKRSIDFETTRSLRVNPDITPPPEIVNNGQNISQKVQNSLKILDIEKEVEQILDDVYKILGKALTVSRQKYCNETSDVRRASQESRADVLGIIEKVVTYAESMVEHAVSNLTSFCEKSESIDKYQRYRCQGACSNKYYSTKNNLPFHSTKNKPYIPQSTWHQGGPSKIPHDRLYLRAHENETEIKDETIEYRKKREVDEVVKIIGEYNQNYEVTEAMKTVRKRAVNPEDNSASSEAQMLIKRQSSEREGNTRGKDSTEGSRDSRSSEIGENEAKTKRERPASEEEEKRPDEESRENSEGGEKEAKTKRERPASEEEEKRPDEESRENSAEGGKKKAKRHKKRPASEEDEKQNEKDSRDNNRHDSRSVEGEKKKKKKRPKKEKHMISEINEEPESVERALRTVDLSKDNKEFYKQRRWKKGLVPYIIDKDCTVFDVEDLRRRLDDVNAILRRRTCTRIREIRPEETNKYADYVVLDNSPDFVTGRVGGKQHFGSPELLKGGQHRQHAAMMVMAMLGFYFEVARHDRDEHVKVHLRHVRADKLHHFEKIAADGTLSLPYDYKSAMQPAWMYWRKIGKKGISTVATYKDKDPDGSIMRSFGQHQKLLSEGDIIKINTVYGIKCMNGGQKSDNNNGHDD